MEWTAKWAVYLGFWYRGNWKLHLEFSNTLHRISHVTQDMVYSLYTNEYESHVYKPS